MRCRNQIWKERIGKSLDLGYDKYDNSELRLTSNSDISDEASIEEIFISSGILVFDVR